MKKINLSKSPEGFKLLEHRSAYGELVGPIFQKIKDNRFILGFRVDKKHINLGGFAHGGMLATFADIVMGHFETRDFEGKTVTVKMNIDFISVANLGDWVEGSSRLINKSSEFSFVDTIVYTKQRKILTASAMFKNIYKKL
ncbi:PaaI family thioesterase [Alphaproteobacteria bacterium]|nr:PaaI family thioesterase [Alphaproteobacteria bacterium]